MDAPRQDGVTVEETAPKKKRTPGRLWRLVGRIAALVATILLVLAAVYLVVNRDKISVDSIRRAINYRFSNAEDVTNVAFDGDTDSGFATMGTDLLVCSRTTLQLFARTGDLAVEESVSMSQPVADAAGDYAVVYDAGGSALYVLHDRQLEHTYTTSGDQGILSARVDENGYVTVVEQATSYKAAVTVYDASFEPVLTENISSSFITDAILSPDKSTLALVSIGEDDAGFNTDLIFYSVSDGTEQSRCSLDSDVVLDLDWEKNALWVIGEYGAYCIQDGEIASSSLDTTRYLRSCSLGGDGFAAMYQSKYQSGGAGSVALLTEDGKEISVAVSEEVREISAAGDYLAVLTGSTLTIYKSDLTVYATAENSWSARRVLMREDGSAVLIAAGSASLYLPD